MMNNSRRAKRVAGPDPTAGRMQMPAATGRLAPDMLAGVLDQLTEGFLCLDRAFLCTYVNRRAAELVGRSPAEMVGRNYYELFPEAVGTPFEKAHVRAMSKRVPVKIEGYFAPWDRWFENRISPTSDGISILFSDITERKRAEAVAMLHADLLTSVTDAIVATDADLKVVYWNSGAQTLFGWPAAEVIGRAIGYVVETLTQEERTEIIGELSASGSWRGEAPRRRRDGSWFDAEIHVSGRRSPDGTLAGIVGVIHDVTERKAELRRTTFQAELLSGAQDAIIAFRPDQRIQLWNRGAEELFGWTAGEAIGQTTEILAFAIDPVHRAAAAAALARGERWRGEATYQRRDGTVVVAEAVVAPAIGEQGEPIFYSIIRDATERVRLQGEAEAARRGLEALHEVELTIVETSDFGTVATAAARAVRSLTGCDLAAIGHLDGSTGDLVVSAVDGDSAVLVPGLRVESPRETLDALRAGEVVYISDLAVIATGNASAAALSAEGWGAALNAPLRVETELVGNIAMLWRSAPSSVDDVQAILTDIGTSVAIGLRHAELRSAEESSRAALDATVRRLDASAIERARLASDLAERASDLENRVSRLDLIRAIDDAILSGEAVEQLGVRVLDAIQPFLGAARTTLVAIDPKTYEMHPVAVKSIVTMEPITSIPHQFEEAVARGTFTVIDDTASFDDLAFQTLAALGLRSLAILPLAFRGRPIGRFVALWTEPNGVTESVRVVLPSLAQALSVALEQLRLRNEIAEHVAELETRVEARTAELADINMELDAFSATVAHDLRAPLRSMHGFAQALVEDEGENLSALGHDYTDRIREAAQRMEGLIGDLLEYSRLARSRLSLRKVSLDSAVQVALEQVAAAIVARGAQIDLATPLGHARADRSALIQALANLIGNAVKFVPPDRTPQIRVSVEAHAGRRRLWVQDNGIGIESRHRERVFLPFERLHGVESYPGTGVGLAVVRRILGRMGGECGFESEPGRGSRFWIELAEDGPK